MRFFHIHSFADELSYDETSHWYASTCGHDVAAGKETHNFREDDICDTCGYADGMIHSHTYSSKWTTNETHHWLAATCEHSDEKERFETHGIGDDGFCVVCGYAADIVIGADDIEQGGWAYGQKKDNSKRIRVDRLIYVKAGTVIRYDMNGLELYIDLADGEDAKTGDRVGWLTGSGEYLVQRDAYLGLTIAASGRSTAIAPAGYTASITIIPGTGEVERTYEKVNVYKFGGEGNDWCFVYLPEGYDPDRAEPYPFVIANHGNGWNMDGTAKKANWTDWTMYMSAAEIAKQSESKQARFIATEDESLWYSNPTIEALLAAGYIVCGAQNYGDTLYGNDNCTDATVAFFNHMQETYNVEDTCHMIGASNGAMTTLNAAAKLGEKVTSVIIQYPLTSLIDHYVATPSHQEGIELAYGLDTSKTYTKEELLSLIGEYDPLYNDVVDGVKQSYFPAVKVYYSTTDTLTQSKYNAVPLLEMLERSGVDVEGVQVDADGENKGHGHPDHFDPEGFVEWFDKH